MLDRAAAGMSDESLYRETERAIDRSTEHRIGIGKDMRNCSRRP